MGWWPDWLGYIDYIHIMGYMDDYESHEEPLPGECYSAPELEGNPDFFRYTWKVSWGVDSCGYDTNAISMGMPAWLKEWGDKDARGHLQDLLDMKMTPGVCFWNLELPDSIWREPETWELLKKFREKKYATTDVKSVRKDLPAQPAQVFIRGNNVVFNAWASGKYSVELFDVSGRLIEQTDCGIIPLGITRFATKNFNGSSGTFLIRISGPDRKNILAYTSVKSSAQ
jgi:hypothetical protein